jgi:tetratricopeptide (TPR) repeat protein
MHNVFWMSRSLLFIALLLSDTVALRHREAPAFAEITLEWPARAQYTASADGRELLLQFNRGIDIQDSEALPKQLPLWVEAVTLGFDTMLIRSSRDVTYDVRAEGNSVVIRLNAIANSQAENSKDDVEGERRLQLLRAQLLIARRQNGEAEQLLEKLVAAHPGDISALSSLAQVEQQAGRWQRSSSLYDQILQIDPRNEEARELRSEVLADHSSRIGGEAEIKNVSGDRTEQISRISAQTLLKSDLSLNTSLDENHTTSGTSTYNRQRGEVSLRKDFQDGSDLHFSAFGSRDQAGGGLGYRHTDSGGDFNFQADYRRPFWEFRETIVGYGVRDRAEIRRNQRLGQSFDGRFTLAMNRYGVDGIDNAARSMAYDGAISWAMHSNPYIALEYSVDKESVGHFQQNTLPLVSREVHAGTIDTQFHLSRQLLAEGSFGFVRDRLGAHAQGPFMGGRLTRGGSSRLRLQVWFERRRNSVETGQIVNLAGATLNWRFQ